MNVIKTINSIKLLKGIFALILLVFLSFSSYSQSSSGLHLFGSGASFNEVPGTGTLHSSFGEPMVGHVSTANQKANIGFLQNFSAGELNWSLAPNAENCGSNLAVVQVIDSDYPLQWKNLKSQENFTLTLFHRNGNVLHQDENFTKSSSFYPDEIEAGTYLYSLRTNDDKPCIQSAITIIK